MVEKKVLIFKDRINISKPELIHILDNPKYPPVPSGIYFDWGQSKYGEWDGNGKFPFQVGFNDNGLQIFTYWHEDTQITWGENRQHGLRQFSVGKVEIIAVDNDKNVFDVSIISEWSPLKDYYKRVAEELKPFTIKPKIKTFDIEPIKYKGSVSEFRAWMDIYLSRGGGNLLIPLPRDVQMELMKRTMKKNDSKSDIIAFPNIVVNINYSLQDKDTNREVWYAYLYDPRISRSKQDPINNENFVSVHQWATILAVENPPNNTIVEFFDGILFRRVRDNGEVESHVRGQPIGEPFSSYMEHMKKQWIESRKEEKIEKLKNSEEMNTEKIVNINLQTKPAGRKVDHWNPIAFDIMNDGKKDAQLRAYEYWCEQQKIKNPNRDDRKNFKKAMKREQERRGRNREGK